MRPRRIWTEEEKDNIRELRKTHTLEQMREMLHVSPNVISTIVGKGFRVVDGTDCGKDERKTRNLSSNYYEDVVNKSTPRCELCAGICNTCSDNNSCILSDKRKVWNHARAI